MLLLNVDLQDTLVAKLAEQGSEAVEQSMSLFDMAVKGGWIMIVLGVLSVMAIYIFIDKFVALKNANKDKSRFMDKIKDFIFAGKVESALDLCKITEGPLARMIEKGIIRIGRPLNDVNVAVENIGKQEIAKLEKGLPILATIAGGAPMIGFLGTVMGMVTAFFSMSKAGSNLDVGVLSEGIYLALVTTVGGLIVGIVAYFAYNILVARVNDLVANLESKTTEFMDILNEPVK